MFTEDFLFFLVALIFLYIVVTFGYLVVLLANATTYRRSPRDSLASLRSLASLQKKAQNHSDKGTNDRLWTTTPQ